MNLSLINGLMRMVVVIPAYSDWEEFMGLLRAMGVETPLFQMKTIW
jgi:hypothetical protein